jgi:hypothetical protein
MISCKTFLLFALIPLVVGAAKKSEENNELPERVPELRAQNVAPSHSHSRSLARIMAILWKTRASLTRMEARYDKYFILLVFERILNSHSVS